MLTNEQVEHLNYLSYDVPYNCMKDLVNKVYKFQRVGPCKTDN